MGAGLFFDEAAFAEVGVEAAALEELFVAAAFEDAASIEDEDLVGVADRGEAVGDDETCAVFQGKKRGQSKILRKKGSVKNS
jgi:hypothetical protein